MRPESATVVDYCISEVRILEHNLIALGAGEVAFAQHYAA